MAGHGIGIYKLGMSLDALPGGAVTPFSEFLYLKSKTEYGATRLFPNEEFYTATERMFLGARAIFTIISAVNRIIFKVAFFFVIPEDEDLDRFNTALAQFLATNYGRPESVHGNEDARIALWKGDWGNAVLQADPIQIGVIFTASRLQPKKSLLGSLFGVKTK